MANISALIALALPLLVTFFVTYIPNNILSQRRSHLSNQIVGVVDTTIHPCFKPSSGQHLFWNAHYKLHGILTMLLVDFDMFIAAVVTNILGHSHDANTATYNNRFTNILDLNFTLGDPGFQVRILLSFLFL